MSKKYPNKYWNAWVSEHKRRLAAGFGHAAAYLRANALIESEIAKAAPAVRE